MFRIGCLLAVLVIVGIPVVASQYLTTTGTLLLVLIEAAVIIFLAPKVIAFAIKRFAVGLFKTKSQVLRGAQAHIRSLHLTDRPVEVEDPENDEHSDDESTIAEGQVLTAGRSNADHYRYVQIDFTVTPMPGASKMAFWEPGDLMIVPFDMKNEMKEEQGESAHAVRMVLVDESGGETAEFDKVNGRARLRAVFACPPQLQGRAKFRYYFESFGDLLLP